MKIETDLAYIEQMGDEREDENVAFRSFLKNLSISDEELDAIVHQINDEVTAQIDCTACANCCKVFGPILNDEDISTFASGLELSVADLESQYLKLSENEPSGHEFREQPCPFLVDNRCSNVTTQVGNQRESKQFADENQRLVCDSVSYAESSSLRKQSESIGGRVAEGGWTVCADFGSGTTSGCVD